jgi:hypothetical protein
LGYGGASSLPWPHLNFLENLKEIKVDEGVGSENGEVGWT